MFKTIISILTIFTFFTSCKKEFSLPDDKELETIRNEKLPEPVVEPTLLLTSPANLVNTYTNSTAITIVIADDIGVTKWCISEIQTTIPTTNCAGGEGSSNGWHIIRPNSFNISSVDGLKTVYL